MDMDLSLAQTRVIGCLLEKEITTPDQYPLSLNALTAACNQKSNRDPVMSLAETDVQNLLDELTHKRLIREESGFGSRVVKYRHRFCNTEFSDLQLSEQELAIVCTLLLRGPQTPGELRSRTNRLCDFKDVHEVESVLQRLCSRGDGALTCKLQLEPGKREARFAHLFSGEVDDATESLEPGLHSSNTVQPSATEYIQDLEQRVEALEKQVAELMELID